MGQIEKRDLYANWWLCVYDEKLFGFWRQKMQKIQKCYICVLRNWFFIQGHEPLVNSLIILMFFYILQSYGIKNFGWKKPLVLRNSKKEN
jgi:hypothetical protein